MPKGEQPEQLDRRASDRELKQPQGPSAEELVSVAEYRLENARAMQGKQTSQDASEEWKTIAEQWATTKNTLSVVAPKQGETMSQALRRKSDELEEQKKGPYDLAKIDKISELQNKLKKAIHFVDGEMRALTAEKDPEFKKWMAEKQKAGAKRTAEQQATRAETERTVAAKKFEGVYQDLGVESPAERERSMEKAIQMVLEEGGVKVHTSIERSLSPRSNSGFQDLDARMLHSELPQARPLAESQLLTQEDKMRRRSLEEVLESHGIHDIVSIHHDKKEIYETVTIPGKKGFLGVGKTPDRTERRYTGRSEPVFHSDIVEKGKKEPAVRFAYVIPQGEWRDYSGRKGQFMSVEIVLPESTAKEIEQALDRDPALMRKIVERVMKEKLLKDPKAWETPQGRGDPLGPPYEKWDSEPNGGKIYIQKEGVSPGWHEEFVRKVKKE